MIDYFNLADNEKYTKIFYSIGSGVWQTWDKPKDCNFINFFVLGGGGGGASGSTGNLASSTRVGGGGGGSSAITKGLFPSFFLPETLYILVGRGGLGQTPTSNGTSGEISFICISPTTADTANIILKSGTIGPTCSNSNAAGSAGTVFPLTGGYISYLGLINTVAGVVGYGGGTNASPIGSPILILNIVTGGAGGGAVRSVGNTSNDGGGLTGSGFIPSFNGGITIGTTDGQSGVSFNYPTPDIPKSNPMVFTGGLGGAGMNNTNGGRGGNGSFGCGGGGGGGSTTGNGIPGSGGDGGDGLVIITCW